MSFEGHVPNEITVQAPADTQKRLIFFVTDFLNRGYRVRDAVSAGFKALADSLGELAEVRVTEETFEKTVAYFEKAVETYRAQQETGAVAVGGGIYAEAVGEDEYRELARVTR
jgi:ribosomal protein S7